MLFYIVTDFKILYIFVLKRDHQDRSIRNLIKIAIILFLRDVSVPPTNNVEEMVGRKYKRKMAEVMCFRSLKGSERCCDCLSIMESIKASGVRLYEGIQEQFER